MCGRISAGVLFLLLLQAQKFTYAVASSDHIKSAEYTISRRETPSGGCQLPQHPQNGVYTSPQCLSGDDRPECRNLPGTTVTNYWLLKYHCSPNYSLSSEVEFSICNNGTWQNPLHCLRNSVSTTNCGSSNSTTHQGQYPWVAGIYYKTDCCEVKCGGTLISPHIVVTGQYSWVARIYYKTEGDRYEMRCGGILISPHIVVTCEIRVS
ncbi:hypothetical protein J6590_015247 [Homalodisca vitripennis]|nr:hypothetical protein J6590_015247 [Homalodisca vitripennis]